jgi:hypothetical protein
MRADAELDQDVLWELRHRCSQAETADFFRQLEWVRDAPITRSEMHVDRRLSRYVLRRFAFGSAVERIAIFEYDGRRMRVIECRLSEPRRMREPHPGE